MPNEYAIDIANLSVELDGRRVLRGFDLRIAAEEKVALTGPSGSGKSTVLKCVLGLVVPREGSIRVRGRPVDGRGAWEARRRLAYVAQEPELGTGTVRQAMEHPFTFKANAGLRDNLKRLPTRMEQFRLPPALLGQDVSTLSGGEKQRLALLLALLLERPILLLDEASSALDKAGRRAVADFLRQANGLTVLSVAHDTEWLEFSDRVVDMGGGERRGDLA